ncbi:MAG: LAGLIDADG family homing endonuclease [bacterium]
MPEVSRAHSTSRPIGRGGRGEPSQLNPNYVVGFVDGEGCFSVNLCKHNTLKRRVEIRAQFEIELRIDDKKILERIQAALGCGKIYELDYPRYRQWQPHAKYKVSNIKDLKEKIVPFFERHPLQAKKAESFKLFSQIVGLIATKQHLTDRGYKKALKIRERAKKIGKKARNR